MPTEAWILEKATIGQGDEIADSLADRILDLAAAVGALDTSDLAAIKAQTDRIDALATDGLAGVSDSLAARVHEIEKHLHSRARMWGSNGAATETNAIAATVSVPFVAVSGNDAWGAAIPICGTADDPTGIGYPKYDPHLILVTDTDHNTPYRFRIVYGQGTSAAAIAADQWSEEMFITAGGPFSSGVPLQFQMPRVTVGWKLWAQVWNTTNGSNVDFYWGEHPYVG